jgi:hypothetical protein
MHGWTWQPWIKWDMETANMLALTCWKDLRKTGTSLAQANKMGRWISWEQLFADCLVILLSYPHGVYYFLLDLMPCETLHFLARPWLLDLFPAGRLHPRGRKFSGFAEFRLAKLGWFAVSQELFSGSWCFLCLIFHDFPLSFHHEIPVVVLENEAVSLPPGNFQKQIRTAVAPVTACPDAGTQPDRSVFTACRRGSTRQASSILVL